MKSWIAFILALGLVVPVSANFSVGTIGVNRLAIGSQVIAVADVTEIVERSGVRVAVAKVVRGLKGAVPNDTIEFVAEKTWTCDISNAVLGERVLLYLIKVRDRDGVTMFKQDLSKAASMSRSAGRVLYELYHSGRGRIVINRSKDGDWLAVKRRSGDPWTLNVNLTAPKQVRVFNSQPVDRRPLNATGRVLLTDILAATETAIDPLRLKYRILFKWSLVNPPPKSKLFSRNNGP